MGSILPTYRCRNGSQEEVDGEAARSVHEDGGGGLCCKSGSGGNSDDGRSSSRQQLDVWCLDSAGWRRELRQLWRLGFRGWKMLGKAPIYRGNGSDVGCLDSRPILSWIWAPNRWGSLGFHKGDSLVRLQFWFLHSGVESDLVASTSGSSVCGQRGHEKPQGQDDAGGTAGQRPVSSISGPFLNSAGLGRDNRVMAKPLS
jgi:hypothetical protein